MERERNGYFLSRKEKLQQRKNLKPLLPRSGAALELAYVPVLGLFSEEGGSISWLSELQRKDDDFCPRRCCMGRSGLFWAQPRSKEADCSSSFFICMLTAAVTVPVATHPSLTVLELLGPERGT